jgi:DMSO/TMAO reductase YedYZ molybdopterin-dependent catalytic subunit
MKRSGWRAFALVVVLVFAAAAGFATEPAAILAAQSSAATPAAATTDATFELKGLVTRPGPVAIADLQQMPQETVDVSFQSGGGAEKHTYTGVRLFAALDQLGLAIDPEARNPLLTMYIVITAKDGYQLVLSGGEIDPNFGHEPILLTWNQDGKPLEGDQAPLRLVVPGDLRGGRYIFGIVSIDVRSINDASS